MNATAGISIADIERKPRGKQRMAWNDVLTVPWRSAHRALRWFSLVFVIACVLGAIVTGWFVHPRTAFWWIPTMLVYCGGVVFAWAFWFPTALLLAIDARRLRLPGMQRTVHVSMLFYALLTIALPTLVLGALGADALVVALLAALAVTVGLAFVLLPRWLAMWIGFLPMGFHHVVHYPPMPDPRWLVWGALALVVLLIVDVLRWRHLLRSDTNNELGLGSAMVLQFRRQSAVGNWSGLQQMDSGQMIRQRPDWMQPRADLRHTGPQHTVRTLRVALGGWYLPKTLTGYLRAAAPVLLPILLMIPVMALISAGNHRPYATHIALIGFGAGLAWAVMFAGLMLTAMTTVLIRQRWQRSNAELPLLALLPGLGDARHVRSSLLRAALVMPVATQLLLLLAVLIAAWAAASYVHPGGLALLLIVLPQLAAAATMIVEVLCTIGGRKLPTWGEWLVYVPLLMLFFVSTIIPATMLGGHPWQGAGLAGAWLLAVWVAMALVLAWVGRRGWRGLHARPHPFMSN